MGFFNFRPLFQALPHASLHAQILTQFQVKPGKQSSLKYGEKKQIAKGLKELKKLTEKGCIRETMEEPKFPLITDTRENTKCQEADP